MPESMDRDRFNTLWNETDKVSQQVRQMASWETGTRDQQLSRQRRSLEALLVGLESIAASIRLGETIPGSSLTPELLEELAEKMAVTAAQARRVWNQPQGRYAVQA